MKRIVGIVFLLFLVTSSFRADHQSYQFRLVWEKDMSLDELYIVDLNDDSLLEIVIFSGADDGEKEYLLTALTMKGEILWQTWVDDSPRDVFFGDIDNDKSKEIAFIEDVTPSSHEPGKEERQITCIDDTGILLFSHHFQIHLGEYEWFRDYECIFADITNDGYKEVLAAHFAFDRNGTIIHQYDSDFSIFEVADIDNDNKEELFLKKVSHDFHRTLTDYSFSYKIVEVNGDCIWEKEYTEPTFFNVLEREGKHRLIAMQLDKAFEVDLDTFEPQWEISFDSNPSGLLMEPEIHVLDLDNSKNTEYVIIAPESPMDYGKSHIYVYDSQLHLVWEYSDPVFWTDIYDIDEDNSCEFVVRYKFFQGSPFCRVLTYDGTQRWNLDFEVTASGPEIVDVDADGKKEVVFDVYPPQPPTDIGEATLLELLEKLRNLEYTAKKGEKYFYIFDFDGRLEMQFKIPFSESREKFCDFDGDGDVDVLFRPFLLGRRIYLYTNTVHRGILDDISTDEKTITSIDLGERWFTRNAYINVRWRFESEKLKNIVDNPSLLYTRYLQEFQIVLAVLLCIIIGLSLYAAKSFKKREPQWELLWTPKRVILYFAAAIVIPPAALGYFIYKVVKESDVYRSALGFIRITRKQILISGITGLLLFAASWCLLMLFTLNRIMLPDTSETEYIVEHYFVVAAFLWGITAPIVEEIVFSGYTYPLLRARVGVKLGIVGCALLFSVLHLKLVVVPVFFMAAVIKLYAYERTHCIYVPVIIHFINNLIVITTVSLV